MLKYCSVFLELILCVSLVLCSLKHIEQLYNCKKFLLLWFMCLSEIARSGDTDNLGILLHLN